VVFTPLVLIYQGWSYWIFRKRISADRIPDISEFAGPTASN
jgi:cytochrome d ubiquinol oxidase subunit II